MKGESARRGSAGKGEAAGDIAERLPLALYRWSPGGDIRWANQAMAEMFGFPEGSALLELDAVELHSDVEEYEQILKEVAGGRVIRARDVRLRDANGVPFSARLTASPVLDDDGLLLFVDGALEVGDTDNRGERAQRLVDARLRRAVDDAEVPTLLFDDGLRIVRANQALCALVGRSTAALVGRHLAAIDPSLDERATRRRLALLRAGEVTSFTVDNMLRRIDGDDMHVRTAISSCRDDTGNLIAYLGQVAERTYLPSLDVDTATAFLGDAFETSPFGMVVTHRERGPVRTNAAFRRMLGIPAGDIDGLSVGDLMHPDDFGSSSDRMLELATGGLVSYSTERRLVHRDGHHLWVLLGVSALRGPGGEFAGVLSQVIDITERRTVEEALRDSEARFRTAYDHAPVGMVILRPDLQVESVNAAMCRMLGCTADEVMTVPMPELMGRQAARVGLQHMERLLAGEETPRHVELEIHRRDGSTIWTINSASVIRDSAGDATGLISQTVDVTAQHLAQQATARTEAENLALLESIPDLMFRLDANGVILAYRAGQSLGPALPPEAFLGKSLEQIYPHKAEAVLLAIEAVLGSGTPESVEYELDIDGEPRMFEARISKMSDDQVVALIRDITDRKVVEEQLQALIRSKDEFVAAVSHELRTPLTTVVGLASELRDRAQEFTSDEQAEFVDLIAGQSREMADLVDDLLAAAQADVGLLDVEPMFVDLRRQVDEVVAAMDSAKVKLTLGPDVVVLADPFRVRQVVRNLVTNAIRYGGDTIEIDIAAQGNIGSVRVCDDGPGIPEGEWELIFDPYYRAHQQEGQPASLGLGLTIGRMLAWLMNGELTYRHADGWSIFELTLPIPGGTPD